MPIKHNLKIQGTEAKIDMTLSTNIPTQANVSCKMPRVISWQLNLVALEQHHPLLRESTAMVNPCEQH